MSFGDRLRTLRNQAAMTQQQVAESLQLMRATYTYYETGKTFPDLEILMRIAQFYGVSTDFLLNDYRPEGFSPVLRDRTEPEYADSVQQQGEDWDLKETEQMLIMAFRRLDTEGQLRILNQALEAADQPRGEVQQKKETTPE